MANIFLLVTFHWQFSTISWWGVAQCIWSLWRHLSFGLQHPLAWPSPCWGWWSVHHSLTAVYVSWWIFNLISYWLFGSRSKRCPTIASTVWFLWVWVLQIRLQQKREEIVNEITKTRLKLSMTQFKLCQLTKKKSSLENEMEQMEDRTVVHQPMWIQDVEVDPPMMDEPESKIFKDLACAKCVVIMRDTMVFSCQNLHSVCQKCLPRLQICPQSRLLLTPLR